MPPAGPAPISLDARNAFSGTGFSREGAGVCAIHFVVRWLTLSRLKPVLQSRRSYQCACPAASAQAGEIRWHGLFGQHRQHFQPLQHALARAVEVLFEIQRCRIECAVQQ